MVTTMLREAREATGMSQRELAKRLGVSQQRVALLERDANPSVDTLERVAKALGMRPEINLRPKKGA